MRHPPAGAKSKSTATAIREWREFSFEAGALGGDELRGAAFLADASAALFVADSEFALACLAICGVRVCLAGEKMRRGAAIRSWPHTVFTLALACLPLRQPGQYLY